MDRGGTRHYRLLAEILSTALAAERNPRTKALAAGRAWGLRLESGLESPPEVAAAPRSRSTTWSRCSTSSASPPSAGHPTGSNRSACGTARSWNSPNPGLPSSARYTSGSCKEPGNLGGAGHRRAARRIRRTGSVPGPPHGGWSRPKDSSGEHRTGDRRRPHLRLAGHGAGHLVSGSSAEVPRAQRDACRSGSASAVWSSARSTPWRSVSPSSSSRSWWPVRRRRGSPRRFPSPSPRWPSS